MLPWLKTTLADFRKAIISVVVVSSGAGIYLLGGMSSISNFLINHSNSIITISGLLLVGALLYFLGSIRGKNKYTNKRAVENTITEDSLVNVGGLKWRVVVRNNGDFTIDNIPFCNTHEMRLAENWPLYLCPHHPVCGSKISQSDINSAYNQVHSIIEHKLRETT